MRCVVVASLTAGAFGCSRLQDAGSRYTVVLFLFLLFEDFHETILFTTFVIHSFTPL